MRIENREFVFCFQVWQRVLVKYCSVSDSGVNAGDRKYRERIVGNEIKMEIKMKSRCVSCTRFYASVCFLVLSVLGQTHFLTESVYLRRFYGKIVPSDGFDWFARAWIRFEFFFSAHASAKNVFGFCTGKSGRFEERDSLFSISTIHHQARIDCSPCWSNPVSKFQTRQPKKRYKTVVQAVNVGDPSLQQHQHDMDSCRMEELHSVRTFPPLFSDLFAVRFVLLVSTHDCTLLVDARFCSRPDSLRTCGRSLSSDCH